MRRRDVVVRAIAAGAAAAVCLPVVWMTSLASWDDEEWVHGEAATSTTIGTGSLRCDAATTGFGGDAAARLLQAGALGLPVDDDGGLTDLNGLSLSRDTSGGATAEPTGALDTSTAGRSVYHNELASLGVLGGTVQLEVPQLTLPLRIGDDLGALSEYAAFGADGQVQAASGLITEDGGLDVAAEPVGDDIPYIATVQLSDLVHGVLPTGIEQIADVALGIGAVEGHAAIDGCAIAKQLIWGTAATVADRGYWIAGLGLDVTSPLVGSLVTPVANGLLPAVTGAVSTLTGGTGSSGSILNALTASGGLLDTVLHGSVLSSLPGLSLTSVTGTTTISGIDLAPLQALLTETVRDPDGLLSIDLGTGEVHLDLAALLGDLDPTTSAERLNGLAPNTELLLNQDVVDTLSAHAATALDAWAATVVDTLRTAIRGASVTVTLNVGLGLPVPALLGGGTVPLADITVGVIGALGSIVDGDAADVTLTQSVSLLGSSLLNTVLGLLGITNILNTLTTGVVNPLLAGLTGAVAAPLTSTLLSIPTTLSGTLLGTSGVVPQLVDGLVAPIAQTLIPTLFGPDGLVSLTVNVQPDQPGAPEGTAFTPASDTATAQYAESALRLSVGDVASGAGGLVILTFASASAGPVLLP